ncbi:NosD domain-containing protein [Candidatus Bipolaricaulota sp. J31]
MILRKALFVALLVAFICGPSLARENRGPIAILSDADFTPENGVVRGSGTPDDPYVIAGWRIDMADAPFAIHIRGVSRPFVIRDVEICGARVAAIKIETTKNGRIEDVILKGSPTGILIAMSRDIWVRRVAIKDCSDAVRSLFSSELHLSELFIEKCTVGIWFTGTTGSRILSSYIAADLGVLLELGSSENLFAGNGFFARIPVRSEGGNTWDDGHRGNYWESFSAPDADGDGILDLPHQVSFQEVDRFPLASFIPPTVPEL